MAIWSDMIETYRQGLEEANEKPVSFEGAVSAWYEEVYGPAYRDYPEK